MSAFGGFLKRVLGRGGSKEALRDPAESLPKILGDPYQPVVSFYAGGRLPMEDVREQLAQQFEDPDRVGQIAERIEAARKAKQNQHP